MCKSTTVCSDCLDFMALGAFRGQKQRHETNVLTSKIKMHTCVLMQELCRNTFYMHHDWGISLNLSKMLKNFPSCMPLWELPTELLILSVSGSWLDADSGAGCQIFSAESSSFWKLNQPAHSLVSFSIIYISTVKFCKDLFINLIGRIRGLHHCEGCMWSYSW